MAIVIPPLPPAKNVGRPRAQVLLMHETLWNNNFLRRAAYHVIIYSG